jgi:hypothetical protein
MGMRIERNLHLPVIDGKVFAETKEAGQMSEINIFEPSLAAYTWGITFSVNGPTAHYVPAVVTLYEEEAKKFRQDLLVISDKIDEFRTDLKKDASGEAFREFELQNSLLKIKETENNELTVELNAGSPYWTFSREIPLDATKIMADRLKNIEMQSQKMIYALKLLAE